MTEEFTQPVPLTLDHTADLETVLNAWHAATVRLERTHESLRDEVCRLSDELEVKNRELARKNRLADLGQMASHIAHEVRNNLVPVTLYLSLLRRRVADDTASMEILDKVELGFQDLDITVNDLLSFTSDRDPIVQPFPLRLLAEEIFSALKPQFSAQGIRTFLSIGEEETITADRDMLRRAVLNLVLNAVDAMPDGGTLEIKAVRQIEGLDLSVIDTGPGLTEEARIKGFEPFFTTKQGGTGLGLAIVDRIAEAHGGQVSLENSYGGGASITLRIPNTVREAAA